MAAASYAIVRIMQNRKNRRNRTRKRCVPQFLRSRLLRFAKRESRIVGAGDNGMGKVRYFYYNDEGEKRGGFSGKEIKALAKSGLIKPETVIETEDGKKYRAGGIEGMEFRNTDTATIQDSSITIPSTVQTEFLPVPIPQPIPNKIPVIPSVLIGTTCGVVAAVLMLCVVWTLPDHTLSDMKNVLDDTQRKLGQAIENNDDLTQTKLDLEAQIEQLKEQIVEEIEHTKQARDELASLEEAVDSLKKLLETTKERDNQALTKLDAERRRLAQLVNVTDQARQREAQRIAAEQQNIDERQREQQAEQEEQEWRINGMVRVYNNIRIENLIAPPVIGPPIPSILATSSHEVINNLRPFAGDPTRVRESRHSDPKMSRTYMRWQSDGVTINVSFDGYNRATSKSISGL